MNRPGPAAVLLCCLAMFRASTTPAETTLDLSQLDGSWTPFSDASAASKYVGAKPEVQKFKTGLSIGLRQDIGLADGEWGIEGGVFQNSHDDRALYAGVWVDWPVIDFSDLVSGRLGVFFAYAEYPRLKAEADDLGVLTIGDFVPILAAQAAVQVDERFSLTARFGPGIDDADLIIGVQALYLF